MPLVFPFFQIASKVRNRNGINIASPFPPDNPSILLVLENLMGFSIANMDIKDGMCRFHEFLLRIGTMSLHFYCPHGKKKSFSQPDRIPDGVPCIQCVTVALCKGIAADFTDETVGILLDFRADFQSVL